MKKTNATQAIRYFTKAFRLDPKLEQALYQRAVTYAEIGQHQLAVADLRTLDERKSEKATQLKKIFQDASTKYLKLATDALEKQDLGTALKRSSAAISFDPENAEGYRVRGRTYGGIGAHANAITDFSKAIELDPNLTDVYFDRGLAHFRLLEYGRAIDNFLVFHEHQPQNDKACFYLGWIYATCPDPAFRDGEKAVQFAKMACKLTGNREWLYLDALAAAYAENGDFLAATKWQANTIENAPETEHDRLMSRIQLYKMGKAYWDE